MRGSFQVIPGILLALLSILVVLGSMVLSMAESGRMSAVLETSIAIEPNSDDVTSLIRLVTATRMQASLVPTGLDQPSATPTAPGATECPHEENWIAFSVLEEANLVDIAGENNLDPETLRQMNCLSTNRLAPGQTLYLPAPTGTPTEEPTSPSTNKKRSTPRSPKKTQVTCGAPRGWVIYVVRRGDTLSSLAHRLNTSVPPNSIGQLHGEFHPDSRRPTSLCALPAFPIGYTGPTSSITYPAAGPADQHPAATAHPATTYPTAAYSAAAYPTTATDSAAPAHRGTPHSVSFRYIGYSAPAACSRHPNTGRRYCDNPKFNDAHIILFRLPIL